MLHSVKSICGKRLGATDDKVGYVEDCYFDETNWVARYFVADTDWWSYPRRLLLSPHAFKPFSDSGHTLPVTLTRDQIEKGPTLDWLGLVTREFEKEYYQYYGWPAYWDGGSLWGPTDIPSHTPVPECVAKTSVTKAWDKPEAPRPLLRSARAIFGFHVCSNGERDGRLADLLLDEKTWHIAYLVLDTGRWLSHKEVLISTRKIVSIDWNQFRVNVAPEKNVIDRAAARPVLHGKMGAFQPVLQHA